MSVRTVADDWDHFLSLAKPGVTPELVGQVKIVFCAGYRSALNNWAEEKGSKEALKQLFAEVDAIIHEPN